MSSFFAITLAVIILLIMGLFAGALLGFASQKFKVQADPLVDQIDALLPQTQCGQCGHPGCRPYAEAVAQGEAINHCVPGGQDTINKLAHLLNVEAIPLDSEYGVESEVKKIAFIREIGRASCRERV